MVSQDIQEIRRLITKGFDKVIKDNDSTKIEGIVDETAYGHLAGTPIEEWVRSNLSTFLTYRSYYPNQFLEDCFNEIGKNKNEITAFLENTWWGTLLATGKQIEEFIESGKISRWQQEGADIVVFYGNNVLKDSGKVILINVKSHESTRDSRPPNIMSAQRLLVFIKHILNTNPDSINEINLFFIGVDYENKGVKSFVNSIHIKDLYRLDLDQLPQINFDAAIQIQWNVKDMIEKDQTKIDFIKKLAKIFLAQWEHHSKQKFKKYKSLVSDIESCLNNIKSK